MYIAAAVMVALCGIAQAQDSKVQRGRYLVLTGHCNNCHTAERLADGERRAGLARTVGHDVRLEPAYQRTWDAVVEHA
jgi:mono/diheme cytochrome c family protein